MTMMITCLSWVPFTGYLSPEDSLLSGTGSPNFYKIFGSQFELLKIWHWVSWIMGIGIPPGLISIIIEIWTIPFLVVMLIFQGGSMFSVYGTPHMNCQIPPQGHIDSWVSLVAFLLGSLIIISFGVTRFKIILVLWSTAELKLSPIYLPSLETWPDSSLMLEKWRCPGCLNNL